MNRQRDTVRNLRNKVVLITGGSRGPGFALATELASRRPFEYSARKHR